MIEKGGAVHQDGRGDARNQGSAHATGLGSSVSRRGLVRALLRPKRKENRAEAGEKGKILRRKQYPTNRTL